MSTHMHIELPVEASDLIWMLTKCRNIFERTGYFDEVQDITNLIDAYYTTEELRRPERSAADLDTDLPF